MENKIVNVVLDFLKEAGQLALNCQNNLSASLKQDHSIVTETDITISKMFNKKINDCFGAENHKILDEENLPSKEELFAGKNEYLWTIDPIDGTTTYFYGFNLWAIAIGLYKNYEPYMGFIYIPSIGELVYTDSIKSYHIKNIFTDNESRRELKVKNMEITPKSIILAHRLKNYNSDKFVFLDLYSSYVLGFYTLTGNGIASCFTKPKLWDMSATLPIAVNMKMDFKSIKTDKNIYSLKDLIIDNEWRLSDVYMMCNSKVYNRLKNEIFIPEIL